MDGLASFLPWLPPLATVAVSAVVGRRWTLALPVAYWSAVYAGSNWWSGLGHALLWRGEQPDESSPPGTDWLGFFVATLGVNVALCAAALRDARWPRRRDAWGRETE